MNSPFYRTPVSGFCSQNVQNRYTCLRASSPVGDGLIRFTSGVTPAELFDSQHGIRIRFSPFYFFKHQWQWKSNRCHNVGQTGALDVISSQQKTDNLKFNTYIWVISETSFENFNLRPTLKGECILTIHLCICVFLRLHYILITMYTLPSHPHMVHMGQVLLMKLICIVKKNNGSLCL